MDYKSQSNVVMAKRLEARPVHINIIQEYALTCAENDERIVLFYKVVEEFMNNILNREVTIIIGDIQAKICSQFDTQLR